MRTIFNKVIIVMLFCSCFSVQAQTGTNAVDATGKKDGLWKGIYQESKRPRYEGTFNHGKEKGLFKFFDDTKSGSVIATREFSAQDNSAYTIFYDQANNKVSEGMIVNKLFEEQWKYYHKASNVVMTIENYKNGKLEGLRSVFYPSGKIAEESYYKKNLKEGAKKIYAENGIVLEESIYKNNKYNGTAIFRDALGNIASSGVFLNNKKVGIWTFYEKGKQVKQVNMSFPGKDKMVEGK